MMRADEIREKMESLKAFIDDADISVRTGKMVNLAGLDKDVSLICQKALSLPPDQAREIQPLMAALIGGLEGLSLSLKDYRDNLKR